MIKHGCYKNISVVFGVFGVYIKSLMIILNVALSTHNIFAIKYNMQYDTHMIYIDREIDR